METPSSVKRLNNNVPFSKKYDDSGSNCVKSSRRRDMNQQKPLIDITNDSPIVGLASGSFLEETPSSAISSKQRGVNKRIVATPGSGEALLRGQVKTLLQKVEEEAEISKLTVPPFMRINQHGFIGSSPMGLLAPTPANTPQVFDLSSGVDSGLTSVTPSPLVVEQQVKISGVVNDVFDGKKPDVTAAGLIESQKSLNRSLLFDFSEKSDLSSEDCSSQGKSMTATTDDDSSSVWSVQVNASAQDEEESEEGEAEDYCSYDHADDIDNYDEFEGEAEDELSVDALCDGLSQISVNCHTKFSGKHSKFVYDSDDDEIAEVVEVQQEEGDGGDGVLRLKGLPTPKGKHLRFAGEDDN